MVDPGAAALVERIYALAAAGHTPGDISRTLGGEGATTQRGKPWTTRAVRTVIENRDYLGENGYPELIDQAVWERAQRPKRTVSDTSPRTPADDFVLGGMVVCFDCGAAMRSRHCSLTGDARTAARTRWRAVSPARRAGRFRPRTRSAS